MISFIDIPALRSSGSGGISICEIGNFFTSDFYSWIRLTKKELMV